MKINTEVDYQCEICKQRYSRAVEAIQCENKPVTQDKGVKVGDRVLILRGDNAGQQATVTDVYVTTKDWGHYAWERYWHTIRLTARCDDWGSRMLTFDDYDVVKK